LSWYHGLVLKICKAEHKSAICSWRHICCGKPFQ